MPSNETLLANYRWCNLSVIWALYANELYPQMTCSYVHALNHAWFHIIGCSGTPLGKEVPVSLHGILKQLGY